MRAVGRVLPTTFNWIASASLDHRKLLIVAESDIDAGSYYLFDTDSGVLREIGSVHPQLKKYELGRMRPIEYPARDGTTIPGYLTLPPGVRAENLPLIVMPHGGPISRDSWRYDFLREFLASRGYAVLNMNFRGSAGYGGKWFRDAHQDWGGLTYSDITDGTKWAVASGIADPGRICMLGWSFGGYAALLAAVRNEGLYKCSISIAGLSHLPSAPRNWVSQLQIGTDRKKIRADSPSLRAAATSVPVLLIHGDRDVQASVQQSYKMADALEDAKVPHKLVVIRKGDHALWRESERALLLTEVEQFLSTYMAR